jgi:uncharacterized membrane protein
LIGEWFKKNYQFSPLALGIGLFLLAFALVVTLIPASLPRGSVHLGEDGTNYPREKAEQTSDMPAFQHAIYAFGDASCHQKESRSFHIIHNQQPLCARCTAIYIGFAAGALFLAFFRLEIKFWHFVVFLLPMAVDGGGQTILGLWESTNLSRLVTGLLAGVITGAALGYVINEISLDYILLKETKKPAPDKPLIGPATNYKPMVSKKQSDRGT